MPNELDRRSTRSWPRSSARAGGWSSASDELGGRSSPTSPRPFPSSFATFCALNADNEAVVAGDERLSFADLDRISDRLARGLAARGIGKGDRVGIAMRNCPAWIVSYMAILKAGAIATLLNGWWEAARDGACDPADRSQADHRRRAARQADRGALRRPARSSTCRSNCRSNRRSPTLLDGADDDPSAARDRARGRCDDPLHVGLDRRIKGRGVDAPRGDHRRFMLMRPG